MLKMFDVSRFNQIIRVSPEVFTHILNLIKDNDMFNTSQKQHSFRLKCSLKSMIYLFGSSGDGLSTLNVVTIFKVGDGGTIQKVTKRVFKIILKKNS